VPAFGRALLARFPLEEGVAYLNHGTVGVTPNEVMAHRQALLAEIERQPAMFMLRRSRQALREAAAAAGRFLGADGKDVVFVENATAGVNAVLRSLDLCPGDEVVLTDHTYGAVRNTALYLWRRTGAVPVVAQLPFPVAGPEQVLAAVEAVLTPRTRVAVLDHVTSHTGLKLPVAELAQLCRRRGIATLIDGAHAPGMFAVDIPALGVDWYVGNMHKWAFAPRGSAVLWTRPELQAELHPTSISHDLDRGMAAEFDWTGTRDLTPHLAAPAGIAFLEGLGAEALWAYNHALALEGTGLLAKAWGGDLPAPAAMTGAIALAPLPARLGRTRGEAEAFRQRLYDEHAIEMPAFPFAGRLWARLSAQAYNEISDFERVLAAVPG